MDSTDATIRSEGHNQNTLLEFDERMNNVQSSRGSFFKNPPGWLFYLLIGGVALCFNLFRLGEPSVWFDEALSIERARQPLDVLWKIIFATQPNMALYYLILHFWLHFTHTLGWLPTEFVVRFPSTIFAALSSLAFYFFAQRFLSRTTALIVILLYMLNPLQLTYAQETRSYSLQLLLLTLSWYFLLSLISEVQPRRRALRLWIGYCIINALAVYTHLFSLLVIAAQIVVFGGLWLFSTTWQINTRKQLLPFIASLVGTGVIILPLMIASLHSGKTGWIPAPTVQEAIRLFVSITSGNRVLLALIGIFCVLSVVVVAWKYIIAGKVSGRALFSHPIFKDEPVKKLFPIVWVALCWCVIPFVVSFVISQGSTRLFSTRYLVVIVPPMLLLTAIGVSLFSWRTLRVALSALLLLAALFSVPLYYQSAQVEDWKVATFWLQRHAHSQDGMVCYDNGQGCELDVEYYLRAYPSGLTFPTDSPGAFAWVSYDLTNIVFANTKDAEDPHSVSQYGMHHKRIFYIVGRLSSDDQVVNTQGVQKWMDSHYHLLDKIETRTVTIRLYQTQP